MAFPTFALGVVLLGVYAIYKYVAASRRNKIPSGLKKLPGPKGMSPSLVYGQCLVESMHSILDANMAD